MQIPSRFTIAVHTLMCIDHFAGQHKATSEFIASSVNVNPDITLLDVLQAIEGVKGPLFNFHENPNPACPVGAAVRPVLEGRLQKAQSAMEQELASTSLADLLKDVG